METLVYPADSRASANRLGQRTLNLHARSYEAPETEDRSNDTASMLRLAHLPHQLAKHPNGSHLMNFPFVFVGFTILTTGLVAVGLGITVTNPLLTGVGFLTTLAGCFLYGWSLYED